MHGNNYSIQKFIPERHFMHSQSCIFTDNFQHISLSLKFKLHVVKLLELRNFVSESDGERTSLIWNFLSDQNAPHELYA